MKGATLLASNASFFEKFCMHLRGLTYPVVEEPNSIRLAPDSDFPFTFYDRSPKEDEFFLKYEAPPLAIEKGLIYCYPVECKSEILFCDIVGSAPSTMNILVFDSNGDLYTPEQLTPETISL